MSGDIYSDALKKQRRDNFERVKPDLDKGEPNLLQKISRFAIKYDVEEEYVKTEIRNGHKITLAYFSKDPSRQNFYERVAADYIRNRIEGVKNFRNLANNELYVCRGKIIRRQDLKEYPTAKTIDFSWEYERYQVYVSHKYTHESGGAQDNAYKDLQSFIQEARENRDDDHVFIAIADGAYYQQQNGKVGTTRFENMQRACTSCVKISTIYTLQSILNSL